MFELSAATSSLLKCGTAPNRGYSPNLTYPLLVTSVSPGLPDFRLSITVPPTSTTSSRRRSRPQRKNCPQSRDRRSGADTQRSAQGGRRPCVRGSLAQIWASGKKTSCRRSKHCPLRVGALWPVRHHYNPSGPEDPKTQPARVTRCLPDGGSGLQLRPLLACRLWCGGRRRAQFTNGVMLARCVGPGSNSDSTGTRSSVVERCRLRGSSGRRAPRGGAASACSAG